MKKYLKKLSSQRSTWGGLSTLLVTAGYVAGEAATGGLMGAAIALVGGASGLLETFRDESK